MNVGSAAWIDLPSVSTFVPNAESGEVMGHVMEQINGVWRANYRNRYGDFLTKEQGKKAVEEWHDPPVAHPNPLNFGGSAAGYQIT